MYYEKVGDGETVFMDFTFEKNHGEGFLGWREKDNGYWCSDYIERDDPLLIQIVEELGNRVNGRHAKLEVTEIPDGISWYLDEYDGMESIHEDHRSWQTSQTNGKHDMLTDQEREKFAVYLEQSAASDLEMIEQLKKMGGQKAMIKKMNTEALAARIISVKLRDTDTETF